MSTLSHPPTHAEEERRPWIRLLTREGFTFLAIFAMWIAVAVTAVWGGNMVFSSNDGNSTTLPSVAAVALFAFLGTWAGFRHGLDRGNEPD